MAGFLNRLFNWRRRLIDGWVDVNILGFTSHRARIEKSMRWNEVRQIDVGRQPTGIVEDFYVVLFGERETLTLDDRYIGFNQFQAAMFDNWPEIEKSWTRIFTGPPDVEEYVTLWKRRESY